MKPTFVSFHWCSHYVPSPLAAISSCIFLLLSKLQEACNTNSILLKEASCTEYNFTGIEVEAQRMLTDFELLFAQYCCCLLLTSGKEGILFPLCTSHIIGERCRSRVSSGEHQHHWHTSMFKISHIHKIYNGIWVRGIYGLNG